MSLYGRQGKIVARPDQRDALLDLFSNGMRANQMPGCRLYLIGRSESDENAILISEVWDSADAHKASLAQPFVRDLIGQAMPLIESVEGDGLEIVMGWE